jgi:hypothetical protein
MLLAQQFCPLAPHGGRHVPLWHVSPLSHMLLAQHISPLPPHMGGSTQEVPPAPPQTFPAAQQVLPHVWLAQRQDGGVPPQVQAPEPQLRPHMPPVLTSLLGAMQLFPHIILGGGHCVVQTPISQVWF